MQLSVRSCSGDSRRLPRPVLDFIGMKRTVFIAAAVILMAAFAYAGFAVVQKRELHARVAELVRSASGQLDEALLVDGNPPAPGQSERLASAVARAEAGLQQLRALATRPDPALAGAADPYVASVLEVLRRQAGATRHRARFTADRRQLDQPMAPVGNRSA